LLSHFLRYVHGVDSVCVQKIHTTSAVDKNKTPEPQNDSGAAFGCGRRI
jgi:hypothetical protein